MKGPLTCDELADVIGNRGELGPSDIAKLAALYPAAVPTAGSSSLSSSSSSSSSVPASSHQLPLSAVLGVLQLLQVTPLVNVLRKDGSEDRFVWFERTPDGSSVATSLSSLSSSSPTAAAAAMGSSGVGSSVAYNAARAAEEVIHCRSVVEETRNRVQVLRLQLQAMPGKANSLGEGGGGVEQF